MGYCDFSKKKSRVVIGSDRGLYDGETGSAEVSPHPKIFTRQLDGGEDFIMGACGDCAFGDQLEMIDFSKIKVKKEHRKDAGKFLKEIFVPVLKKRVKPCKESEILIAIFDSLYKLDEEFAVIATGETGFAIGSAAPPARAVLYALHKVNEQRGRKKIDALEMVSLALQAAESCSMYCRGPFDIMELG